MNIDTANVHNFLIHMDLLRFIEFSLVVFGIGLIIGLALGFLIKSNAQKES